MVVIGMTVWTGVSRDTLGRKQWAVPIPASRRRGAVPAEAVLVDGAAAEPAPDAADDVRLVVPFDDEYGAGGAAAPAHLAELAGVLVGQERRGGVHIEVFDWRRAS